MKVMPTNSRRRGRDLFDPWMDGHEARQAGLARSANPYRGADSRQLWDDGWMDAQAQTAISQSLSSS
jgi:ribosome modulation factor